MSAPGAPDGAAPETIECWDCGVTNPLSRVFCRECGVFIASRSSEAARAAARSGVAIQPFASRPAVRPADPPLLAQFRQYPIHFRRTSFFSKPRLVIATSAVVMTGILGLAALQLWTPPDHLDGGTLMAGALIASATSAPEAAPRPATQAAFVESSPSDPVTASAEMAPDDSDAAKAGAHDALADFAATGIEGVRSDLTAGASQPPPNRSRNEAAPVRRGGWVCEGSVRIEDPRGLGWSVGQVTFRNEDGYERVTLHLEPVGLDGGTPASVTAEAFASSEVRQHVARATLPAAGRTTISLRVADGVRGLLGLRQYQPRGMETLTEFSAYPASGGVSHMLVSVAADGCFRLQVPAWKAGADARRAEIHLDIRS